MSIFSNSYSKPGPGIPKDLPPKKGISLFFSIFGREFWNLIKLNLIFVLFCIPVVTIGPAYAAMTRITTKMVWDKNVYILEDFWLEFKNNFKRSLPIGVIATCLFLGLFFATQFYWMQSNDNVVMLVIFFVSMIFALVLSLAHVYIYPMLVNVQLAIKDIIRNSFLLGIACVWKSLLCVGISAMIYGTTYWYFPLSLPFVLFITFSFASLVNSFLAWPGIERYVLPAQLDTDQEDE